MKVGKDSIFWTIAGIIFVTLLTAQGHGFIQTFYFVTCLLPVIVFTSYFFNRFLVPKFLLPKKYLLFSLYTVYTIIVSFYLELLLVFLSVMIFQMFQIEGKNVLSMDLISIAFLMYLVTLIKAFIHIIQSNRDQAAQILRLQNEKSANTLQTISIRANRQNHIVPLSSILYLESLGDQLKFVTIQQQYLTRDKISKMAASLPTNFIRIHRSFLINTDRLQSYTKEHVTINKTELPISRTYKKDVLEALKH